MPVCDYCDEEFSTMGQLARHIKKVHQPSETPHESTGYKPCPVCNWGAKKGELVPEHDLTVCPRCLCWYQTGSGKLEQPPPERCLAERSGYPCLNPEHKVFYERYMASRANIK